MSLYIGTSDNSADLIASTISKKTIENLIDLYYMPNVGDVKYLAIPFFLEIDIEKDSFDGWIYANGLTLTGIAPNKFQKAKLLFGARATDTSFTLPNLCYFAKACPTSDSYSFLPSDMPCDGHIHDINTTINYNTNDGSTILSAAFKVAITGTASHVIVPPTKPKGEKKIKPIGISNANWYNHINNLYSDYIPGLHGPSVSNSDNDHVVYVDLNIPAGVDFSVLPTKTSGEDHPNVYPEHVLVAVMVYIGRNK